MAPPNDKAFWITSASAVLLMAVWFAVEQRRFQGPPIGEMIAQRQAAIHDTEEAIGETAVDEILPEPANQPSLDLAGLDAPLEDGHP